MLCLHGTLAYERKIKNLKTLAIYNILFVHALCGSLYDSGLQHYYTNFMGTINTMLNNYLGMLSTLYWQNSLSTVCCVCMLHIVRMVIAWSLYNIVLKYRALNYLEILFLNAKVWVRGKVWVFKLEPCRSYVAMVVK